MCAVDLLLRWKDNQAPMLRSILLLELGVEVDVPLEDVFERAKHSLEGMAVDSDAAAVRLGDNSCSSRLISQKGKLSEVTANAVIAHSLSILAGVQHLDRVGLTRDKEEQITSLLTFFNYLVACLVFSILEGLSDLRSFIGVDGLQERHLGEELFVLLAPSYGGILHNMVERLTVELVKQTILESSDGGRTRSVVQQSQLTEGFAGMVLLEERGLWALEHLGALQVTLRDDVQAVTLIALLYNHITALEVLLGHGVDDDLLFGLLEAREHEGGLNLAHDRLLCFSALLDDRRHKCLLLVVDAEHFG